MSNMKTNCTPARDQGAVGRDDVIYFGQKYIARVSAPGSPRMSVKQP